MPTYSKEKSNNINSVRKPPQTPYSDNVKKVGGYKGGSVTKICDTGFSKAPMTS